MDQNWNCPKMAENDAFSLRFLDTGETFQIYDVDTDTCVYSQGVVRARAVRLRMCGVQSKNVGGGWGIIASIVV